MAALAVRHDDGGSDNGVYPCRAACRQPFSAPVRAIPRTAREMPPAATSPGEGSEAAAVGGLIGKEERARSGTDSAVHVEGEQQLAGELVGAADEVPGGAVEGVRRRLEVAEVHVDDVGDAVDQQADGLAEQPGDDDDDILSLPTWRAAQARPE